MEVQSTPTPGGDAPAVEPVAVVPASGEGQTSIREAARALSNWRHQKPKEQESAATAAPASAQAESPAQAEENAAPEIQDPGEATTESTEPQAAPEPIEPPRSWTKEEKEEFKSYPREAQEKIARREQERERSLRQSQNEAAEQRKAIDAEREKVEKARQQYDAALPILLENLNQSQGAEFADIKTMADVQRMANEDFPRYVRWDAWQKQVAAVQQEINASQQRRSAEEQKTWSEFATKQDSLFLEKVPDAADKDKAQKLANSALEVLQELGFEKEDMAKLWGGQDKISLRDHRMQLLVRDAVLWRDAQAKAKEAVKKPLPPVQKPGTAQPRTAAADQLVRDLEKKLEKTGSLKDAAALATARRRAQAR